MQIRGAPGCVRGMVSKMKWPDAETARRSNLTSSDWNCTTFFDVLLGSLGRVSVVLKPIPGVLHGFFEWPHLVP